MWGGRKEAQSKETNWLQCMLHTERGGEKLRNKSPSQGSSSWGAAQGMWTWPWSAIICAQQGRKQVEKPTRSSLLGSVPTLTGDKGLVGPCSAGVQEPWTHGSPSLQMTSDLKKLH